MNELKITFGHALKLEGVTMTAFAIARKIDPTHISKWRKGINNLTPELKAVIFKGWKSEAIQIALFDAHFRDEIEAAGATGEVKAVCYNDRDYDLDDN